jgi:hypothetical protein
MVYFQSKNPDLDKFWRVLQWQMLVYYMSIWSILRLFGIFRDRLVDVRVIWYIFSHFDMFYEEKFGNPGDDRNHLKNESAVPLEYLHLGCQIVFTNKYQFG